MSIIFDGTIIIIINRATDKEVKVSKYMHRKYTLSITISTPQTTNTDIVDKYIMQLYLLGLVT